MSEETFLEKWMEPRRLIATTAIVFLLGLSYSEGAHVRRGDDGNYTAASLFTPVNVVSRWPGFGGCFFGFAGEGDERTVAELEAEESACISKARRENRDYVPPWANWMGWMLVAVAAIAVFARRGGRV